MHLLECLHKKPLDLTGHLDIAYIRCFLRPFTAPDAPDTVFAFLNATGAQLTAHPEWHSLLKAFLPNCGQLRLLGNEHLTSFR